MNKYLKIGFSTVVATVLITGCGGDNNTKNTSNNQNNNTPTIKEVNGVAMASILQGATVCAIKDTKELNCTTTNSLGKFSFDVNATPQKLVLKIGSALIGDVNYSKFKENDGLIDPLIIADGNESVAKKIGAFIHNIAGDESMEKADLNLTELKVKAAQSIKEAIKQHKELKIELGKEKVDLINIISKDETYKLPNRLKAKLYSKAIVWLSKNSGKEAVFTDENGATNQITLTLKGKFLIFASSENKVNAVVSLENDGVYISIDKASYKISKLDEKKIVFENGATLELKIQDKSTKNNAKDEDKSNNSMKDGHKGSAENNSTGSHKDDMSKEHNATNPNKNVDNNSKSKGDTNNKGSANSENNATGNADAHNNTTPNKNVDDSKSKGDADNKGSANSKNNTTANKDKTPDTKGSKSS